MYRIIDAKPTDGGSVPEKISSWLKNEAIFPLRIRSRIHAVAKSRFESFLKIRRILVDEVANGPALDCESKCAMSGFPMRQMNVTIAQSLKLRNLKVELVKFQAGNSLRKSFPSNHIYGHRRVNPNPLAHDLR